MRAKLWRRQTRTKALVLMGGAIAALGWSTGQAQGAPAPINPEVYKRQYEEARKNAEVVAQVRVLAAVCTEAADEAGGSRAVTLQLSLQVLSAEKGSIKKNEVLVVTHKVSKPSRPGPAAYGYQGALRRFPFTPGVKGDVALRWDKERRCYLGIAGWVPEPNNAAIPTEAGQASVASDADKPA